MQASTAKHSFRGTTSSRTRTGRGTRGACRQAVTEHHARRMRHIGGRCPAAIPDATHLMTAIVSKSHMKLARAPPTPVILRWIRRMAGAPVLICFPHEGGTVLSCMGLAAVLPDDLAIATLALPGHDSGIAGEPVADARRMAGAVAEEIALVLGQHDAGLTLLGNSFGALLAF